MRPALSVACIALSLAAVACASEGAVPSPEATGAGPHRAATPTAPTRTTAPTLGDAPRGPTEQARVVRVTDGDTIVVDRGRGDEPVRYIGVDTPEAGGPYTDLEWLSDGATAANAALVAGRTVTLERDLTETDRFDRLLRYVWVREGEAWTLVNLELVRQGFARVVTYPPDTRYVELYEAAEAEARAAGLGIWDEPSATILPFAPPAGTVAPGREGCDPAYPTVCIPPPPPDLDCADIDARRFEVLPPDPHRFDGGGDGLGCERD